MINYPARIDDPLYLINDVNQLTSDAVQNFKLRVSTFEEICKQRQYIINIQLINRCSDVRTLFLAARDATADWAKHR